MRNYLFLEINTTSFDDLFATIPGDRSYGLHAKELAISPLAVPFET